MEGNFSQLLPLLVHFPGGGGYRVRELQALAQPGPVASRRVIALKGYNTEIGRALTALSALRRCSDLLKTYRILIYSATKDVKVEGQRLARDSGIEIEIIPYCGHQELIRVFGMARLSIGINISDGIPNTMLESMMMGALTIQVDVGSTREWIEDGVNGLLSAPSSERIAGAIRRALTDDELVRDAAVMNMQRTQNQLDYESVRTRVLNAYRVPLSS